MFGQSELWNVIVFVTIDTFMNLSAGFQSEVGPSMTIFGRNLIFDTISMVLLDENWIVDFREAIENFCLDGGVDWTTHNGMNYMRK